MGDHGKAAAGIAGAGGLDGGVERQQIGLLGDRLDQVEHAVDALGGGGKTLDLGDRLVGAQAGLLDGAGGLADLAADLLDRCRQLFGGTGDGGDVGGSLLGGAGGGDRAAIGVGGDAGDGLRGVAHRGGAVVDGAHHGADRAAERLHRSLDVPRAFIARPGIPPAPAN